MGLATTDPLATTLILLLLAAFAVAGVIGITVAGQSMRLSAIRREAAAATEPSTFSGTVRLDPRPPSWFRRGVMLSTRRRWATGHLVLADGRIWFRVQDTTVFDVPVGDVTRVDTPAMTNSLRLWLRDGRMFTFDVASDQSIVYDSVPGIPMGAVEADRTRRGWLLAIAVAQRFAGATVTAAV